MSEYSLGIPPVHAWQHAGIDPNGPVGRYIDLNTGLPLREVARSSDPLPPWGFTIVGEGAVLPAYATARPVMPPRWETPPVWTAQPSRPMQKPSTNEPVATIEGVTLYEQEIENVKWYRREPDYLLYCARNKRYHDLRARQPLFIRTPEDRLKVEQVRRTYLEVCQFARELHARDMPVSLPFTPQKFHDLATVRDRVVRQQPVRQARSKRSGKR